MLDWRQPGRNYQNPLFHSNVKYIPPSTSRSTGHLREVYTNQTNVCEHSHQVELTSTGVASCCRARSAWPWRMGSCMAPPWALVWAPCSGGCASNARALHLDCRYTYVYAVPRYDTRRRYTSLPRYSVRYTRARPGRVRRAQVPSKFLK